MIKTSHFPVKSGFLSPFVPFFAPAEVTAIEISQDSASSPRAEGVGRGLRRGEISSERASSPRPSPPSDGGEGEDTLLGFVNSTAVPAEVGRGVLTAPRAGGQLNRNDSVDPGSAGVPPAVLCVPLKTSRRCVGTLSDACVCAAHPSAGRRRVRPGRSRSPISTVWFRLGCLRGGAEDSRPYLHSTSVRSALNSQLINPYAQSLLRPAR